MAKLLNAERFFMRFVPPISPRDNRLLRMRKYVSYERSISPRDNRLL